MRKMPKLAKEAEIFQTKSDSSHQQVGISATLEELTSEFGSPEVHRADDESDTDPQDLRPCPLSLVQGAHDLVRRIRVNIMALLDVLDS